MEECFVTAFLEDPRQNTPVHIVDSIIFWLIPLRHCKLAKSWFLEALIARLSQCIWMPYVHYYITVHEISYVSVDNIWLITAKW